MGEVSETAASLRFSGDELDPAEISRLLGAAPTKSYLMGDPWILPNGQQNSHGRKTGFWSLSAARTRPGNLDKQIFELFNSLTQDLSIWRDLSRRFNGDVFAGLFTKSWNEGLQLQPETIVALASRGLRLDLDIYGAADEKE
ncbi:DUF4279 domain-containing protein [Bosea beijingensis]|uniref:DUF4279 domain-containing protein n=1 Tax=Bosea beijingensis TaxID=3068632 RepID=UPI002740668A|nr:DUF4279 domain-containing protein [Bosea sp. REN20]